MLLCVEKQQDLEKYMFTKRPLYALIVLATLLALTGCGAKDGVKTPTPVPDHPFMDTQKNEQQSRPEQTLPESDAAVDTTEENSADDTEQSVPAQSVSANTVFENEPQNDGVPLGYVAPDGWYAPRFTTGKVINGGYDLTYDVMGLKVYEVEKYFGMSPSTWGYYRGEVISNVMWFQEENELTPNGDVDLKTWLALGFSEESWYNIGTYVTPVAIKREDDRDRIIEVFLDTANTYLGTPFVVGASGQPGTGVDCSGFVLQCLYSIGIYPDGLDPVQHSTIEEYNSRLMWADPKFKKVEYNELLEGDLVFYRRPWSNSVCHVAIYVGGNECIEALYGDVEYLPLQKYDDNYEIMGYKRVIAD